MVLSDNIPTYNDTDNEINLDLSNEELYFELITHNFDINDCLNDCNNHGKCKIGSEHGLKCECFEDYGGKQCQINKHPCFYKNCLNNGLCIEIKLIIQLLISNVTVVNIFMVIDVNI